jgi:hypothetical protein
MKKIFFAVAMICCLNAVAFANGNTHKAHKQATNKEAQTSKKDCPVNCPIKSCH